MGRGMRGRGEKQKVARGKGGGVGERVEEAPEGLSGVAAGVALRRVEG